MSTHRNNITNIDLCESCLNREFDLKKGLVCSITNSKRIIDQNCPDYLEDLKRKKELEDARVDKIRFQTSKRRNLLAFSALIPATFLVIVWIVFLNEGMFITGSILGILGYIGILLLFSEKFANNIIIIPFLLSIQVSFYMLFVSMGDLAKLEGYVLIIVLWPFIITKFMLAKIILKITNK